MLARNLIKVRTGIKDMYHSWLVLWLANVRLSTEDEHPCPVR